MQTLNGKAANNDAASFTADVGVWRTATSRYSFAVDGGAIGTYPLFTVTGTVLVQVWGICQTALTTAAGATLEVGIAGDAASIAKLIAQTTGVDIDQYEVWQDATPEVADVNPGAVDPTARTFCITNGADINLTVATEAITAGIIDFVCRWLPISTNGAVVAA